MSSQAPGKKISASLHEQDDQSPHLSSTDDSPPKVASAVLGEYITDGASPDEAAKKMKKVAFSNAYLDRLQKEIRDLPLTDKKVNFLHAQSLYPHLFEAESNLSQFLERENGDIATAATKLVDYWGLRKSLFQEKAFLRLNQTGEGLLGRGDMNLMSEGFLAALPDTSTGHSVLLCDLSKLPSSHEDAGRRIAFYWFSILAENPLTREDGFHLIHIMDRNSFTFTPNFADILAVVPSCIKQVHAIIIEKGTEDKKRPALSLVRVEVTNTITSVFGSDSAAKINILYDLPSQDVISRLSAHGMSSDGLPRVIGGSWGYEKFAQWLELRTRYEWNLPPGSCIKGLPKTMFDFSEVRRLAEMDETGRAERKRRMNVVHSRRKRERQRIEVEVLHEQCYDCQARNARLRLENERLTLLMKEAESIAEKVEGDNGSQLLQAENIAMGNEAWAEDQQAVREQPNIHQRLHFPPTEYRHSQSNESKVGDPATVESGFGVSSLEDAFQSIAASQPPPGLDHTERSIEGSLNSTCYGAIGANQASLSFNALVRAPVAAMEPILLSRQQQYDLMAPPVPPSNSFFFYQQHLRQQRQNANPVEMLQQHRVMLEQQEQQLRRRLQAYARQQQLRELLEAHQRNGRNAL